MKHILDKLNKSEEVEFNPRGNSMTPKIKSGQLVKIKKIDEKEKESLKKGDIVFCKVKERLYCRCYIYNINPTVCFYFFIPYFKNARAYLVGLNLNSYPVQISK